MKHLLVLLLLLASLATMDSKFLCAAQNQEGAARNHEASGNHTESSLTIVWKWGNFLILFGGLAWYLRKPFADFLHSRTTAIQEGLESGRAAQQMASKQLQAIEERIAHLGDEIQQLKTAAMKEAEDERARILEAAKQEAEKILEVAYREIEGIKKSARQEVKAHIADLAVRLAEDRLKQSLDPEKNRKLVLQFIDSLKATKN